MSGPFYFAWCGGAIEPQVTVTTTGTTHGAAFEAAQLIGDADGQQLQNLASHQGLEAGALYRIAGPGIADPTYFLYDDSILSGAPGSINLSQAVTAAHTSATYQATKAVAVGTVLGSLTQGSATVALDPGDLPAGVYGVFGTGIGETDVPASTTEGTTAEGGGGIMTVGGAYLTYDGTGTGTLALFGAASHTETGTDPFGQPTSITTYTVAEQEVRATASGFAPLVLTGFPDSDPALVSGIPSAGLLGLLPGLLYNISGNGIPVGATFVAPASGDEITLDLPATSSEIAALLIITGPRTPNEPFDPVAHARFDEDVLSVEIAQEEGGLATLTAEVRNPGTGLLATGRYLWAWLSWDQAWAPGGTEPPDLVPLFNGRLVGVPQRQANEVVQLQFLARPDDMAVQKAAVAASLQVPPYYDPVWLAAETSEDTVLETYSALYHIDRVSLAVSVSDVLEGEDGTIEIGEDQALYDSFSLSFGQPPLTAVMLTGTVSWDQQAEGALEVTQRVVTAFAESGSAYSHTAPMSAFGSGGGGLISALSGDGLKSDWPKPGVSIGGGWSLSTRNDPDGVPYNYIIDAILPDGWLAPRNYTVSYSGQASPSTVLTPAQFVLMPYSNYTASFPLSVYKIRMVLDWRASRRRTETVSAVMTAGVQRQLSDSAEADREAVSLTSEYVGEAVDPDGTMPIGNRAYRSYFQTARGGASFEYLLLAARAKLRARARSVDVTFGTGWRTALGIGLRHSVRLTDRRLPGGVATGKVKQYTLTASTEGMRGEFVIGCTIGSGDGYDLAYQSLDDFAVVDDGLNLTNMSTAQAVNLCRVDNGLLTQVPALAAFQGSVAPMHGDPLGTMRTMTTTVTLDLKPVTGAEFHTEFRPAITMLALPRTIDLGATSAPGYEPPEPVVTPPAAGVPVYVDGYVNGYQQTRGGQIAVAL